MRPLVSRLADSMPALGRGLTRGATGLRVILAVRFALGLLFSITAPIFESQDELGHYDYARFVARHGRLPTLADGKIEFNSERHQLPLYYLITGVLISWVKTPEDWLPARNLLIGNDTSRGYNYLVHTDQERFPYAGTALSVHVARLVSILLSLVGVWATYRAVRIWLPTDKRVALLAAGLHAFWPQFLFSGSAVTNDIMVSAAASLFVAAWLTLLSRRATWPLATAILALTGALALSKFTVYGLVLFGLAGLTLYVMIHLSRMVPQRRWVFWLAGVMLLLCVGAAGLGLVVQRTWLASTVSGARLLQYLDSLTPQNLARFSLLTPLYASVWAFKTFWGSFGWGNLPPPYFSYLVAGVVVVISLAGLAWRLARLPQERMGAVLLALGFLGGVLVPLVDAMRQAEGVRLLGRFYLSVLTPLAALLAAGWCYLWPARLQARAALALGVALTLFSASLPFTIILPAYARPALLPPEAEQRIQHVLDYRYGPSIRLVGYDADRRAVQPGETIDLTLYWQALQPMNENYTLAVKLLGPDFAVLDETYRYPGRGNYATSLWQPGDFFKEVVELRVPAEIQSTFRGQFLVEFLDAQWVPALPAHEAEGRPVGTWFGEIKIVGREEFAEPETLADYRLNDEIALEGYTLRLEPEASLRVELVWTALQPMAVDYTASLSLRGDGETTWAQADSQPRQGAYPTHLWDPGERVSDAHTVPLPASIPCGDYTLYVGLYELATGYRLPVIGPGGVEAVDRSVKIPVRLEEGCQR